MKREDINEEIQKWIDEDLKNKAVLALLGENIDGGAYYSLNFNGSRELLCQMLANTFRLYPELREIADLALRSAKLSNLMDKQKRKRKIQQG